MCEIQSAGLLHSLFQNVPFGFRAKRYLREGSPTCILRVYKDEISPKLWNDTLDLYYECEENEEDSIRRGTVQMYDVTYCVPLDIIWTNDNMIIMEIFFHKKNK